MDEYMRASNCGLQQLLKDDTGRDANASSSSMTFHSTTRLDFKNNFTQFFLPNLNGMSKETCKIW